MWSSGRASTGQEHRQAVALSQALNGMRRAEGARDVVFVNANAKYNEALIAIRVAAMDLKPGGDIVLINHCPAGQVVHYLYSALWQRLRRGLLAAL